MARILETSRPRSQHENLFPSPIKVPPLPLVAFTSSLAFHSSGHNPNPSSCPPRTARDVARRPIQGTPHM
eukprot:4619837-Prymnesium_polylepis.1